MRAKQAQLQPGRDYPAQQEGVPFLPARSAWIGGHGTVP